MLRNYKDVLKLIRWLKVVTFDLRQFDLTLVKNYIFLGGMELLAIYTPP